jgi:hypothetical protein
MLEPTAVQKKKKPTNQPLQPPRFLNWSMEYIESRHPSNMRKLVSAVAAAAAAAAE